MMPNDSRMEPIERKQMPLFENLPTEIIENIALFCAYPDENTIDARLCKADLCNLRSTSRSVLAKTEYVFATFAFEVRRLDFCSHGLKQLQAISQHEKYGPAVQKLKINSENMSLKKIYELEVLESQEIGGGIGQGNVEEGISSTHFDKFFEGDDELEREYATYLRFAEPGAALLARIFSRLPNVEEIICYPKGIRVDRALDGHEGAYEDAWAINVGRILLAALRLSKLQLKVLKISSRRRISAKFTEHSDEVAIDKIIIPERSPGAYQKLVELELLLDPQGLIESGSKHALIQFLNMMPDLRGLSMKMLFDLQVEEVTLLDHYLVHPPHHWLSYLFLEGVAFNLPDHQLHRFLTWHRYTLGAVRLGNCRLLTGSWINLWKHFESFSALRALMLYQLAEGDRRTYYPMHGDIRAVEIREPRSSDSEACGKSQCSEENEEDEYDEWILLYPPLWYFVQVEPWECMEERLQALQDDMNLGLADLESDSPTGYKWYVGVV